MAIGYTLIKTAPKKEHYVYDTLLNVSEITEIYPLFGEYDLIAKIEAEDFSKVANAIVDKVRTLDGVVSTKTLVGINF